MKKNPLSLPLWVVAALLAGAALTVAQAAPVEAITAQAAKEKPVLLENLRQFVSIETGSRDIEGLDRLAELIAGKLREQGGQVELIEPDSATTYRMEDTPEKLGKIVRATFTGTGQKKIMLIAHMDTVYQRGMLAKQPFRIEGNRVYGLGIADDKQGLALILSTINMLKALGYRDYGTLTVLFNGDEEISSPGSRHLLSELGAEHDVVLSHEASSAEGDKLSLATAGIGAVFLKVQGRASHAGAAPEKGVNALYEMAHQVLQMRDLSDPAIGLKMNWTVASAGASRNVIPAQATAVADVRVLRVADYDRIEQQLQERVKKQLLSESKVDIRLERRRPPLQANAAAHAVARHAQGIYRELDKTLGADTSVAGGGTDAAFVALKDKAAVLERLGLQGYGAHSADAEYVLLDSIEPRLYLLTRLIMDISSGKTPAP